jgi:hypothetical protein
MLPKTFVAILLICLYLGISIGAYSYSNLISRPESTKVGEVDVGGGVEAIEQGQGEGPILPEKKRFKDVIIEPSPTW